MLVLTRKIGEMVRIADSVTVQVLSVRGSQVSLGITAPADVRIFREELYREIESQNQSAQLPDAESLAGAEEVWKEYGHGKQR
jgi:carbon storage regulator